MGDILILLFIVSNALFAKEMVIEMTEGLFPRREKGVRPKGHTSETQVMKQAEGKANHIQTTEDAEIDHNDH